MYFSTLFGTLRTYITVHHSFYLARLGSYLFPTNLKKKFLPKQTRQTCSHLWKQSFIKGMKPDILQAALLWAKEWSEFWVSLSLSIQSYISQVVQTLYLSSGRLWLQVFAWCHGRRKVHECILVILAAQPGPNGQLSCLHSFKIFWPMKPSYRYLKWNNIICGTFWCIRKFMIILKMCFSVNQSSNKKYS